MLKAVLVALMATLTIGFGVVAWFSLRPPVEPASVAEAPPPPPPTAAILATARPVAPGTLLKPDDITATSVPADRIPEGARLDTQPNRTILAGAMARRAIAAQQPILPADILRPTEGGFLAAVLGPDHRAVSVAVDAVSGTAGLIWPGDRVDLILTQTLDDTATPVGRRTLGETVLTDLRVIAVDQQLAHASGNDPASAGRTITLSVLPAQAERVAVAVRLGRVALAVRPTAPADPAPPEAPTVIAASPIATPIADKISQPAAAPSPRQPPVKEPSTTWGQDVSPGLVPRRTTAAPVSVRVFQGPAADKEFKFE